MKYCSRCNSVLLPDGNCLTCMMNRVPQAPAAAAPQMPDLRADLSAVETGTCAERSRRRTCPVCGGEGTIASQYRSSVDAFYESIGAPTVGPISTTVKCGNCSGSGYVE